jgi:hypothetical protein
MDKFEQHIKRMKGLRDVYEPGTGQHNILSILIAECEIEFRQPIISPVCSSCQFWEKLPESEYSVDMGKCLKISGTYKPEQYPDTEITGIESTPICVHDGSGLIYETKS